MCQREDKCNILLKIIANLDEELSELLLIDNSIDNTEFYKIDNTLYKTSYKTDNQIVCWYGYDDNFDKYIRIYFNKSPIDIYIFIDENTHKIVELEFLDWANQICETTESCIDFILNSKIQIEYLPR